MTLAARVAYAWRKFGWALTPRRLANLAMVTVSWHLSRWTGRAVVWGTPPVLMAEPTDVCNLRCPLCPSGALTLTRPRGYMDLETFRRSVDTLADRLCLLLLWNQGEPLLHPDFCEMVRYATSKRIPTMTSTNGNWPRAMEADPAPLVRSGLRELIVSLDGATSETYRVYRKGGDFDRVLQNVRNVQRVKRELGSPTPLLTLQFIVMRHNESELGDIQRLAREMGVERLAVKTCQVYTEGEAQTYLPGDERFSRYERSPDGGFRMKAKSLPNVCRHLWFNTVVNWNGTVTPCCFDKDAEFPLGQAANGQPFSAVWHGAAYQTFRRRVMERRPGIAMCTNCSEGLKDGLFVSVGPTA